MPHAAQLPVPPGTGQCLPRLLLASALVELGEALAKNSLCFL